MLKFVYIFSIQKLCTSHPYFKITIIRGNSHTNILVFTESLETDRKPRLELMTSETSERA